MTTSAVRRRGELYRTHILHAFECLRARIRLGISLALEGVTLAINRAPQSLQVVPARLARRVLLEVDRVRRRGHGRGLPAAHVGERGRKVVDALRVDELVLPPDARGRAQLEPPVGDDGELDVVDEALDERLELDSSSEEDSAERSERLLARRDELEIRSDWTVGSRKGGRWSAIPNQGEQDKRA